jgi:hypothetical protein
MINIRNLIGMIRPVICCNGNFGQIRPYCIPGPLSISSSHPSRSAFMYVGSAGALGLPSFALGDEAL